MQLKTVLISHHVVRRDPVYNILYENDVSLQNRHTDAYPDLQVLASCYEKTARVCSNRNIKLAFECAEEIFGDLADLLT